MLRPISLLFIAALLFAQATSSTLTGIITDSTQARLPGVSVRITSEETGRVYTANSNPEGEYTIPLLPSGVYSAQFEAKGFKTLTQRDLTLELGRVQRLDAALELGNVTESVVVTAEAPLLESESSSVGQFIENKTIADMPLNGRRVGDLLALTGSAVHIAGDVIRPRVSLSGGRADHQQWLLDGVNSSNIALEIPQALFNPPVEAVQEIRIHQNAYSAEFGNTTSGVVTMTTRSGSNTLSGVLYEYFRNDALDARNFFAASKAPLRWNMFGGAAGGPVIRNRTFYFGHVEFQRQRIGTTRLQTTPTALERAGDFSQTFTAAGALVAIYDPATLTAGRREAFPGNVIPASRQDPVGRRLASLFPLSNRPAANRAGANNWGANGTNALNITTWTAKVDHVISERDRVSGRLIVHDFPTYNIPVFDTPAADPNGSSSDRRAYSLLINESHQFTPSLINDFRYNYQPRRFHNKSYGLGEGWPTQIGLRGVSDRAFPRINATAYTPLGSGTHERLQIPIRDNHLVDAVSFFRGAHAAKFGGEMRSARNVDNLDSAISGVLSFGVQPTSQPGVANTGNAIAAMLLGFPMSASVLETDILDRRARYWALFLQDDWKAAANFTVNIGVRWETHTPRIDAEDRQNGFDPLKINPVSGTPGVITFAGRDGVGRAVYSGDYNNVAPRIGFAWKVRSKTVVRSGYGVFFGVPLPGSNSASAGFETSGDFQSPDNGLTAPFFLRDGFPRIARTELDPGFGAVHVGQPARLGPQFIEVRRQLGYTQQWNFTLQQETAANTILEVSYQGNVGHKLNGPETNINQVRPELMGPGNAQIRRPFPQFANVSTIAPMWGNSSYHGFNAKAEKRFSDGLNFLANYTWSKFIDDVPAGFEAGAVAGGMQNYYDRRSEKALSGNDIPHRFVVSSVWEIPYGRARRFGSRGLLGVLAGGWNLGGILTLQAGPPLGLVTQANSTNAFTPGSQRVDVLRNPSLPKQDRRVERWFDTSAVTAPPQFRFGNAGRALLRSPGLASLNLSLLKNFAMGDRLNWQFRAEAFNALNRANFDDPGRALGAANFGVIGAAANPRNLQLGLKFSF